MLATNRHVCQEVRHMTSHSLNGRGAAATAVIRLDPGGTLARMLHDARVAIGYTSQDALARDLNVDRSVVTKAESGNRFPSDKVLLKWCELCHLDPAKILAKARKARDAEETIPTFFETFREVELIAHTVRTWNPMIVPGPLQTPEYARGLSVVLREEEDRIEDLVAARIDLQQKMFNRPKPAALLAVMDEGVLRRRVGSQELMHRQLMHLADQGQRQHVGIQIVPADSEVNAGHVGAFTIASAHGAPDVLLSDGVEDVTTELRPAVVRAHMIFDQIRLHALSGPQSLELIGKVAKECKP
jgi:transcriptional regulator with XRE-family HTH domain